MNPHRCQRWRGGQDAYRPAGEPIDPAPYAVELVGEADAKAFVVREHYSRSYPAARCRVGLYRAGAGLVGVAVFSVPIQGAAVSRWTGQPEAAGVELGRFVLRDDVPANGETWFLRRAFALLRADKPDVRAVLSYSDPERRLTADGRVVMPGHVGTIYQAFNGRYRGRGRARMLHVAPDGTVVSPRALSKVRLDEQGAAYAYAQLRALGAPARRPLEAGDAYVRRALSEGPFRAVRHPGNHVYAWGLDRLAVRALEAAAVLPYPKRAPAERASEGA